MGVAAVEERNCLSESAYGILPEKTCDTCWWVEEGAMECQEGN
jgi:hypothetical protein